MCRRKSLKIRNVPLNLPVGTLASSVPQLPEPCGTEGPMPWVSHKGSLENYCDMLFTVMR